MVDKSVTIKGASNEELEKLLYRLRREREAQGLIADLRRMSTPQEMQPYADQHVSTEEPIKDLYHYGVKGQKWGVRRSKAQLSRDKQARASRKAASKGRRTLSDADLKKKIDRLQNEKKLKDLTDQDLAPGRTMAKRILSTSGEKAAKTVVTAATLFVVKKAVEQKFGKEAARFIPKPKK